MDKNMRYLGALLISALFSLSAAHAQQEEKLTITTYYPSPTGVYQTLRVAPGSAPGPSDCTGPGSPEGKMYYDQNGHALMICSNSTGAWGYYPVPGAGGPWVLNNTNVTVSNTTWRVGIGTMSPSTKLDVYSATSQGAISIGGVSDSGSTYSALYLADADKQSNWFFAFKNETANPSRTDDLWIGRQEVPPTSRVDIAIDGPTGKVGIGSQTPDYLLDVADRIRVKQGPSGTAGVWLYQNTPAANRAFMGMRGDDYVGFWGGGASAWGMTMNVTTLNVGIGTNTPTAKLDVAGGINTTGAQSHVVEHVLVTGTPACTATCPAGKRIILALFFHGANANNMIHMLEEGWVCGSAVTWMGQCLGATSCSGSAVSCGSCSLYVLCE